MTNPVLLNNIAHKDLKVINRYGPEFGDNVSGVIIFPTEYGDIQREYPILFRRDPVTNEFQSVALLGFEKNENLFLNESAWNASYIPGVVARGPFMIGFQEQETDGELRKEPVIHVDIDSSRISFTEGVAVFKEHGGNTPYLEQIASILQGIHAGLAISKMMFEAFDTLGLIEPLAIDITLADEQKFSLTGYYTISKEKLIALDGSSLEKLNRSGFLQGAFLVTTSLNNIKKLIDIKNRKIIMSHND